jgi:hypothetical protein
MTELDWRTTTNPYDLLTHLEGRASRRKLRLFAGGVCRRLCGPYTDARVLQAIDTVEGYAEGLAGPEELATARAALEGRWRGARERWLSRWNSRRISLPGLEARVVWEAASDDAWDAALGTARDTIHQLRREQCELLRDIFGNPFRPAEVRGAWLGWEAGLLRRMALEVHEERAFDRLPLLGDALEDAGCTDEEVLAHCRQPLRHARGCWVVDLVLGRS